MLQCYDMENRASRQSLDMLDIISHSPAQTIRIGQRLGDLLHIGDMVLLYGDFGAGKTHLTKGVAQGLGSDAMVNSPSFVLINEYRAGPAHRNARIYHVDLYRLEDPEALHGIGLEDVLDGHGIAVIEWAERAEGWLPADYLAIHLRHLSETKRALRFSPHGSRATTIVEALKQSAFS